MAKTKKKEYISFADMFDGGGAGQSGDKFEGGGIISEIGNALGGPKIFGNKFVGRGEAPGGGTRTRHEQPVGLLTDAFDGGGFGYSGNYFSDGPYSMLANVLGVQPQGSENLAVSNPEIFAAQSSLRPQARPDVAIGTTPIPEISVEELPPSFTEFVKSPAVSFLTPMAQMRMYDALYGGPAPQMVGQIAARSF
jgi:hypothetical protein